MCELGKYWCGNVGVLLFLIEVVLVVGVKNFVFFLICVIYGDYDGVVLDENIVQMFLNVYGVSKCVIEDMLKDFGVLDGLCLVIFCYFNVVGVDFEGEVGEFYQFEIYLILLIFDVIDGWCVVLIIYGMDYLMLDGICICDYVYVMDLVDVYVLGLWYFLVDRVVDGGYEIFCFGIGNGFFVCEVIEQLKYVMNCLVLMIEGLCCGGDVVKLVLGLEKVVVVLGWNLVWLNMQQMVVDVWRWYQNGGYVV